MESKPTVVHHPGQIKRQDRHLLHGHQSCVLWFTGLSGSGKSTIAVALEKELYQRRVHTYILDGDNLRLGLNRDLGFGHKDRTENIRRIGEVAKLLVDAGIIVIAAAISPYRSDREQVRSIFEKEQFIEVYVECPISECERRDPKGLYSKARKGEIPEFTGVSAPYEAPLQPEIHLQTDRLSLDECVSQIISYLSDRQRI